VAILGSDEPPAVEVVREDAETQFFFVCDHASARIPRSLDNLGLEPDLLQRHVAWDIGAAEVARRLGNRFKAPLLVSGYSRLVIDVNRRLEDAASIAVQSDGHLIPGNRDLSVEQVTLRAETFFWPYHWAIARQIDRVRERGQVPAIISLHSFTPEFGHVARPWPIGVLWNNDGRIARPLMQQLRASKQICVGDNQPYSAHSPYGYTMNAHAETAGLPHVLIEVRQDIIATAAGADQWSNILGDALSEILEDHDIYHIEHFIDD